MIVRGFQKRYIFLFVVLVQLTFYAIYFMAETEKQLKRANRDKRLLDALKKITSVASTTNLELNHIEKDKIILEKTRINAFRIPYNQNNIEEQINDKINPRTLVESNDWSEKQRENIKKTNKSFRKICNLENRSTEASVLQQHPIMEIKLRFPLNGKRMKILPKLTEAIINLKDLLYDNGQIEESSDEFQLRVPLVYEPHPWFLLEDKMTRLHENPIYQRFNITSRKVKPRVNLLLIVNSAPRRSDRRFGIRLTWWTLCRSTKMVSVKCLFMTDKKDLNTSLGIQLKNEQQIFGDLEFQPLRGGFQSGNRLLYHMIWAVEKYDFDYFLRLDDDYFVCLDRLLLEIPMPPKMSYHWGYIHCDQMDTVRPDESFLMLSSDLITTFIGQDPNIMMCLPVGDEMIGQWKADMKLGPIYHAESRLHHHPPAALMDDLLELKDVCQMYIGIHGSYPKEMNIFWKNRGQSDYPNNTLETYYEECYYEQYMNWTELTESWSFEPKRCILNPSWNQKKTGRFINEHGEFGGREHDFREQLNAKRFPKKRNREQLNVKRFLKKKKSKVRTPKRTLSVKKIMRSRKWRLRGESFNDDQFI